MEFKDIVQVWDFEFDSSVRTMIASLEDAADVVVQVWSHSCRESPSNFSPPATLLYLLEGPGENSMRAASEMLSWRLKLIRNFSVKLLQVRRNFSAIDPIADSQFKPLCLLTTDPVANQIGAQSTSIDKIHIISSMANAKLSCKSDFKLWGEQITTPQGLKSIQLRVRLRKRIQDQIWNRSNHFWILGPNGQCSQPGKRKKYLAREKWTMKNVLQQYTYITQVSSSWLVYSSSIMDLSPSSFGEITVNFWLAPSMVET